MRLNNGKHFIAALLELKPECEKYKTAAEEEVPAWFSGELCTIMSEGIVVDHVKYKDDERMTVMAVQCLSHELEQNKFRASTLDDKVQTMTAMFEESGRDWGRARLAMQTILGDAKKSTIQRWVVLARDFDAELLSLVNEKNPELGQAYIIGNKYLLGTGEEARYRLNKGYAKVALERLFEVLAFSRSLKAEDFVTDVCCPMKHLEMWERQMTRTYGRTATNFPAFTRLVRTLQSEAGRQKVLKCVQQRLSLGGRASDGYANAGIEECRVIMQEMDKMQAGKTPGEGAGKDAPQNDSQAEGVGDGQDCGGLPPSQSSQQKAEEEDEEGMMTHDLVQTSYTQGGDPVLARAKDLAQEELVHISVHSNGNDWKEDVSSRVLASHKAIVFIDAPTSKSSILHAFLKLQTAFPAQFAIWMPVGSRFDIIAAMQGVFTKAWPKRPLYIVMLGKGQQSARNKPSMALFMPLCAEESAPLVVSNEGCRAKASEGLRLRCANPNCKHRPGVKTGEADDDKGSQDQDSSAKELDLDDLEFEAPDFEAEEIDDHQDEQDIEEVEERGQKDGGAGQANKRSLVSLFPFSQPVAWYGKVLNSVLKAQSMTHLLVLTRTAHPALLAAGRECGLEVIALVEGANPHARSHGEELLKKLTTMRKMPAAKAQTGSQGTKRVIAGALSFIVVDAPTSLIALKVVELDSSVGSWRQGLNKNPVDLDEKMGHLLHTEMERHSLYLEKDADGMLSLFTSIPRKEGDIICPLTSLLFDSSSMLESFLSHGGNKFLVDKLVKITSCFVEEEIESANLFACLIGAGRFLRHFLGIRKAGPNVQLIADPSKGLGDGFLSLITTTRNNRGVAARSMLVANFGFEYDTTAPKPDVTEPDVKKFKGALDGYIGKWIQTGSSPALGGLPPVPPTTTAGSTTVAPPPAATETKPQAEAVATPAGATPTPTVAASAVPQLAPGAAEEAPAPMAVQAVAAASTGQGFALGAKLADGATFLYAIDGGHAKDTKLISKGGALNMRSAHPSSKKIPPKTTLFIVKAGMVKKNEGHNPKGLEWKFSGPLAKAVVVYNGELTNLKELMVKQKVNGLSCHSPPSFPEGVPPVSVSCNRANLRFQADHAEAQGALDASAEFALAKRRWAVTIKDAKAL